MRKYRLPLLTTALVLCIMIAVALYTAPRPRVAVAVTPLTQQDITNTLRLTGTVTPQWESRLGVSQLAQVTALHVTVGQQVQAGDALCTVTPSQTLPALTPDQLAPLLTGALATSQTAENTLYADRDGTVLQLPALGDTLYPALPAVSLGDPTAYQIALRVPELYADTVQVGQSADYTREGNATQSATLTQVAPQAVQTFSLTGSTAAVVDCLLQPDTTPAQPLMMGTSVQVKLYTDAVADAFTVPYTAIYQVDGQEYITVWREEQLRACAVQSGFQLVDCVQVTPLSPAALQMGDWIVPEHAHLQPTVSYAVHAHA